MKHLLTFLCFCQIYMLSAQQIWYVNASGPGSFIGTSWETAFNDLHAAFSSAGYGDQIWVAKGTYYPTLDDSRHISFNLKTGVQLIGGFNGTEISMEQRDVTANPTVLSGEINYPWATDNSYHVVTIYGGDSLTVLDGFTITRGNSGEYGDPNFQEFGAGLLVVADGDHPVARPVIRNCLFKDNRAVSGGGVACLGDDIYICSPEIEYCTFINNRGLNFGGALYKVGHNLPDQPFRVGHSTFSDNYCFEYAGGITVINPSGTVQLQGCTFIRDSSKIQSGAVYFETQNSSVNYEIDSCTFFKNYAFNYAGGIAHVYTGLTNDTVNLKVRKCVFTANRTHLGSGASILSEPLFGIGLHKIMIEQSVFENNYAQNGGSGIAIDADGGTVTDICIDRCLFLHNKVGAAPIAGAFYYRGFGSSPIRNRTTLTNSVFILNDGAIASLAGESGASDTRIVNCSFYRNGPTPFVKFWDADFNNVDYYMNMQILNSVLWEPQVSGPERLFYNNTPSNFNVNNYRVEHSLVSVSDCTYNGVNPCGAGMLHAQIPGFADTTGASLALLNCSPARNRGSNLVADTFQLSLDYEGNPRIAADTVDMGAYEIQGACLSAVGDLPFLSPAMHVELLQNPVLAGAEIRAEIFALRSGSYTFKLFGSDGRLVLKAVEYIPGLTPFIVAIPGKGLAQGVYMLSVEDDLGRMQTIRVMVD